MVEDVGFNEHLNRTIIGILILRYNLYRYLIKGPSKTGCVCPALQQHYKWAGSPIDVMQGKR
jgi:hypothetical protein